MDKLYKPSQWECRILPPFAVSDDDGPLTKVVEDTHKPDGRKFDVKLVMSVIERIFGQAAPTMLTTSPAPESKIQDYSTNLGAPAGLSYNIHKISCELTCKCSGEIDPHATTMGLLRGPVLGLLPWEGKAVLVLAAFAKSYGEFGLISQLYRDNPLANSVAFLNQMPELLQHVGALKPKIEALNNLIKEMLELTRCIIGFSDPPVGNLPLEHPARATAQSCIATAVYWIIQSAVTSSAQFVGLISMSHKYHVWELPNLRSKLKEIHEHLKKQLELFLQIKDGEKPIDGCSILEQLFPATHVDNMKILREIFPSKDDNPFISRSPDKKVHVESLRGKIVLLLFSDLQIKEEDRLTVFSALRETHKRYSQENACEVVWVPIIDQVADRNEQTILKEAAEMPWLTAYPPPPLNSAIVEYVCEERRFSKKTIVVALDGQGNVTNRNAQRMICIWGADAYPFSTEKEESLWRAENLRFMVATKDIEHNLPSSVNDQPPRRWRP